MPVLASTDALATAGDVEARLGRQLTELELARTGGLLEEAGALVLAYLGVEVAPVPVPDAVRVVTSRMVARVLERDATPGAVPDARSVTDQAGPFGRTVTFSSGTTSGGPWLAAADKVMLRSHKSGMTTAAISSGRTGRYRSGRGL